MPPLKPSLAAIVLVLTATAPQSIAHDIPKQRVDRTLQLEFSPGGLRLDYALELDDTTIAADLGRLNPAPLPPDPDEWLAAYGRLIAPKLAESILLDGPDGATLWHVAQINRTRQQHTIYNFIFQASLPKPGRYRLRDTNFGTSDGLSRLGVKPTGGVTLQSIGNYPENAAAKPYEPAWLLDDDALKRTREWSGQVAWPATEATVKQDLAPSPASSPSPTRTPIWAAFLLGLWHTLQPGHGKSWLAAVAARGRGGIVVNISLISGWVISHFAVIALLALLALFVSPQSLTGFSQGLKSLAALLIAAPAAHRLGFQYHGQTGAGPRQRLQPTPYDSLSERALFTGITAGLVPCWEAVGLLLLGISAGHPAQGLALVGSFIGGGTFVMILMIITARIAGERLYRSQTMSYLFMMALDLLVLACGLRLLLA